MTPEGDITTLGRGGSDLSAVALAKAINADVCEIYTDVTGIYTTDPRVVPEARKLKEINFDEMLEMASLVPRSCRRVLSRSPRDSISRFMFAQVMPRRKDHDCEVQEKIEEIAVTGVTSNKNEAKITICGVPDQPGCRPRSLMPLLRPC